MNQQPGGVFTPSTTKNKGDKMHIDFAVKISNLSRLQSRYTLKEIAKILNEINRIKEDPEDETIWDGDQIYYEGWSEFPTPEGRSHRVQFAIPAESRKFEIVI